MGLTHPDDKDIAKKKTLEWVHLKPLLRLLTLTPVSVSNLAQ